MKEAKTRILLAEDDLNLSAVLKDYLEMLDYEVVLCSNGEEGVRAFDIGNFQLLLLDVMMPVKDGFTMAEEIRRKNEQIPIIFITAKSFKEDKIKGFQVGCDDYITKPFSTEELSLRIKAILRRCETNSTDNFKESSRIFKLGMYIFDYTNLTLTLNEETITLTRKEADLLKLLCEHENRVLKREVALNEIWGRDNYFIGRSMDVFITKLRRYLKDDSDISIRNIHGTGFKLENRESLFSTGQTDANP
jgi:two-component system, OmpR family, response regulator